MVKKLKEWDNDGTGFKRLIATLGFNGQKLKEWDSDETGYKRLMAILGFNGKALSFKLTMEYKD